MNFKWRYNPDPIFSKYGSGYLLLSLQLPLPIYFSVVENYRCYGSGAAYLMTLLTRNRLAVRMGGFPRHLLTLPHRGQHTVLLYRV